MRDGSDCLIREESGPWGWSLTPVLLLPNIGPTSAAIESLIGQLAARVGQYSPPGGEDGTGYATFENFPRVSSCAAPNLRDSLCRRTWQFSTVRARSREQLPLFIAARPPNSSPVGVEVKERKEADTHNSRELRTRLNIAVTSL